MYDLKLDWWEHLVDPGNVPMFSGCKTLLLGPALSEIALTPFPMSDSDVKVLHMYPLTFLIALTKPLSLPQSFMFEERRLFVAPRRRLKFAQGAKICVITWT
jgi:hypothetical protein